MMTQTGEACRLPELKERHLPEDCRQSITELLKETYGYDRFRNLEIYDDLFKSRETLCISQGQLIENVIREAEKARKEVQPDNILLTAPTGSGKSLLFQLPAIYLGKEYDQTEAMTLGDRIVIMRDGFIQQIGTPQEVFNHPKNLFVAGFIGTPQMNFFPDAKLTVKDGKYVVELLGKSIVLPEDKQAALRARKQPEGTVTVGVRPVHLSLHQEGFPATIDVSEMMGSEMHLHMTVSGHDVIAVIPTAGLSLDDVRAGGTAHFTFDPELMHLFDPKTEENLFPVENSKAKV